MSWRAVWRRLLLLTLPLALMQSSARAQQDTVPEEPTLTVRITPLNPYLQEEIVQVVRLIAPHPFEEIVLDFPPVEGADMITLQPPKNRKFETYGGEGYIYETRRSIFPKQSGELRIPPVRISGSVGVSRNERELFAVRSEAEILDVKPPPDSISGDWWLVARDVEIDEDWSKPLDELRVGDRVTRSISVKVAGATGAHLPELEQGRSTGLTVLPGRTERGTEITPDGVIGMISRTFDLRVDVDQPINISPVRVVWWNTNTESERRSAAPSVRIEPLPRDVEGLVSALMAEAAAAHDSSRRGLAIIALGGGALLLALAFWLFRAHRHVKPEDRRLRQALAQDNSPISAVRALKTWAEATSPNETPIALERLGQRLGPKAAQRIALLQQAAFGQANGSIDAAGLASEIIGIAQERRRQKAGGVLTAVADRLLGPNRRLPAIDHRPLEGKN